jgi:hypothetical protein
MVSFTTSYLLIIMCCMLCKSYFEYIYQTTNYNQKNIYKVNLNFSVFDAPLSYITVFITVNDIIIS